MQETINHHTISAKISTTTAAMESTLESYPADNCIDGILNTFCHTNYGTNVWFKMTFEKISCIDSVKIVGYKTDGAQNRMDKGVISVKNSGTDKESLCGLLQTREGEDQTYDVECEKYVCGEQVKLSVVRAANDYPGLIVMREMTAYYSTGK